MSTEGTPLKPNLLQVHLQTHACINTYEIQPFIYFITYGTYFQAVLEAVYSMHGCSQRIFGGFRLDEGAFA